MNSSLLYQESSFKNGTRDGLLKFYDDDNRLTAKEEVRKKPLAA
jgi:antitoxin component YwqK of YwqJK toxin-antitoxin module